MAAKYSPYKVERVLESYGDFTQNITLNVVENLYVIEGNNIHKVTPDGETSVFATANRLAWGAKLGPDGNLYLFGNNRAIDKVDLTTGEVSRWIQMPSGKNVRYGDFDDNGNFYAGGNKTDLLVVDPGFNVKPGAGFYSGDEILAVRCFNNYVYVVTKTTSDTAKIYRHQIDATGNLGAQEVVLDMSTAGDFASRVIKGLTFSTSGLMYIATDAPNPILLYNPADGSLDYLYKEILRPYCKAFCWGAGNYIYMINGDATAGEEWKVYKVNVGTTGIQ
jgi:hypothetical protein